MRLLATHARPHPRTTPAPQSRRAGLWSARHTHRPQYLCVCVCVCVSVCGGGGCARARVGLLVRGCVRVRVCVYSCVRERLRPCLRSKYVCMQARLMRHGGRGRGFDPRGGGRRAGRSRRAASRGWRRLMLITMVIKLY